MVAHFFGRVDFVSLQNMHGSVASFTTIMRGLSWLANFSYRGVLAVILSYLMAHYFGTALHSLYHDWTGWRNVIGGAPNKITAIFAQVLWALVFCSGWSMLWKFDFFMTISPTTKEKTRPNTDFNPRNAPSPNEHQSAYDETQKAENFEPEVDNLSQAQENRNFYEENEQNDEEEEPGGLKFAFPSAEDLEMAEVLSLDKENLNDFSVIKDRYRSAIAQYHPDKVQALGFEIQEVAEKKAKEINHAYEYFRKKLKK
jgi:hypothetical protein